MTKFSEVPVMVLADVDDTDLIHMNDKDGAGGEVTKTMPVSVAKQIFGGGGGGSAGAAPNTQNRVFWTDGATDDPANGIYGTFEAARAFLATVGGGKIEVTQSASIPATAGSDMLDGAIWMGGQYNLYGAPFPPQPIVQIANGAHLDNLRRVDYLSMQPAPDSTSAPLRYTQSGLVSFTLAALVGADNPSTTPLIDVQAGVTIVAVLEQFSSFFNDQGAVANVDGFLFAILGTGFIGDNTIVGTGTAQAQRLTASADSGDTQAIPGFMIANSASAKTLLDLPSTHAVYGAINDPTIKEYVSFGTAHESLAEQAPNRAGIMLVETGSAAVFPVAVYDCDRMTIKGNRLKPSMSFQAGSARWDNPTRIVNMTIAPQAGAVSGGAVRMTQGTLYLEDVTLQPSTNLFSALEVAGDCTVRVSGQSVIGDAVGNSAIVVNNGQTLTLVLEEGVTLYNQAIFGPGTCNVVRIGPVPAGGTTQSVTTYNQTNVADAAFITGLPVPFVVWDSTFPTDPSVYRYNTWAEAYAALQATAPGTEFRITQSSSNVTTNGDFTGYRIINRRDDGFAAFVTFDVGVEWTGIGYLDRVNFTNPPTVTQVKLASYCELLGCFTQASPAVPVMEMPSNGVLVLTDCAITESAVNLAGTGINIVTLKGGCSILDDAFVSAGSVRYQMEGDHWRVSNTQGNVTGTFEPWKSGSRNSQSQFYVDTTPVNQLGGSGGVLSWPDAIIFCDTDAVGGDITVNAPVSGISDARGTIGFTVVKLGTAGNVIINNVSPPGGGASTYTITQQYGSARIETLPLTVAGSWFVRPN